MELARLLQRFWRWISPPEECRLTLDPWEEQSPTWKHAKVHTCPPEAWPWRRGVR